MKAVPAGARSQICHALIAANSEVLCSSSSQAEEVPMPLAGLSTADSDLQQEEAEALPTRLPDLQARGSAQWWLRRPDISTKPDPISRDLQKPCIFALKQQSDGRMRRLVKKLSAEYDHEDQSEGPADCYSGGRKSSPCQLACFNLSLRFLVGLNFDLTFLRGYH